MLNESTVVLVDYEDLTGAGTPPSKMRSFNVTNGETKLMAEIKMPHPADIPIIHNERCLLIKRSSQIRVLDLHDEDYRSIGTFRGGVAREPQPSRVDNCRLSCDEHF